MILFVVIFSYLEAKRNIYYIRKFKEGKPKILYKLTALLILHNMIYFVLYFSLPLLIYNYRDISKNYLIIYLGLLFYTLYSWTTNGGKCWFTVEQNKLLDIDLGFGFSDFIATLTDTYPKTGKNQNELNLRDKLYWYYIYSAIGITFYLLYSKYNDPEYKTLKLFE